MKRWLRGEKSTLPEVQSLISSKPHGNLQSSVTPDPRDPKPSFCLHVHQTHKWYADMHKGKNTQTFKTFKIHITIQHRMCDVINVILSSFIFLPARINLQHVLFRCICLPACLSPSLSPPPTPPFFSLSLSLSFSFLLCFFL